MLLWPEKSSAGFYWPLAAAAAPPIMPATSRRLAACSSRSLLAATLALLSGGFQLAVAFRDFLLTPRQHFLRRDVADGTVQADVVVDEYGTNMAGRIWGRETNMGDEYGDEYGDRRDVPTPVSFTLGGDLRQNCSRFRGLAQPFATKIGGAAPSFSRFLREGGEFDLVSRIPIPGKPYKYFLDAAALSRRDAAAEGGKSKSPPCPCKRRRDKDGAADFRSGCPVLLALSAREPALSGAEGAGNLISHPAFLFPESH